MDKNFVAWDEIYSVGFEPIDSQHRELVRMVNTLFSHCKPGDKAADIAYLETINNAMEYAQTHFSEEEKYLRLADYPKLDKHKKEHETFITEIVKSVKLFETGKTAPIKMVEFLKKWLLKHIAGSDRQYAPYLAKLKKNKISA